MQVFTSKDIRKIAHCLRVEKIEKEEALGV
jgi:hypothetical protein